MKIELKNIKNELDWCELKSGDVFMIVSSDIDWCEDPFMKGSHKGKDIIITLSTGFTFGWGNEFSNTTFKRLDVVLKDNENN